MHGTRLVTLGLVALLAGCSPAPPSAVDDGKTRILCSFFPMYVFTKNVVGDAPNTTVEMMLPAQLGCPHDYDLSPADVKRIAAADIYVMNGAGLESFSVEQILAANKSITIIDSSTGVDFIPHDHAHDDHDHAHDDHDHAHDDHDHAHDDHDHAHDDHDHAHDDHDHAYDDHDHAHDDHDHAHDDHDHGHSHTGPGNPHFFSSPKSAARQVQNIADALAKADPTNKDTYTTNAASYISRLELLASDFEEASKNFKRREIVTMHEVFDYLSRDCKLNVVASVYPVAGRDPSPAEVRGIIKQIKETNAVVMFTEPQYPSTLAKTIADEAKIPVESLDPVASGPANPELDYYEKTMRENLAVLKKVLNHQSLE